MVPKVFDEVFFQLYMCVFVSDLLMRLNIFFKCASWPATSRLNIVTSIIKMLVMVDHESFIFDDHVMHDNTSPHD